jgi:hypothetical protein
MFAYHPQAVAHNAGHGVGASADTIMQIFLF